MDTYEMIRNLAKDQGLGDLNELELEYIKTHMEYDWYALEPQMPYDIAHDRGMSYRELKASATPERFAEIEKFYVRNWQPED